MFWIKNFKGHSGCRVQLFFDNDRYIIVKSGNAKLKKSAEILLLLKKQEFNVPDIYEIGDDYIHMEYLNGVDMKNYLHNASKQDIDRLLDFINFYIDKSINFELKNISLEIFKKLKEIENSVDLSTLSFSVSELIEKLPTTGKVGLIHGDFTLDNILFYKEKFYLIDANPTDINSIEFDCNKLRQDLECLWFVRNQSDKLFYKIICDKMNTELKNKWKFMNDNYILIFMLMRILPYCTDEFTKTFLITEINKLWQL